jgi:hypothetical protein
MANRGALPFVHAALADKTTIDNHAKTARRHFIAVPPVCALAGFDKANRTLFRQFLV